jgi:hypothetical protein
LHKENVLAVLARKSKMGQLAHKSLEEMMSFKAIGMLFLLLVIVVVIAACAADQQATPAPIESAEVNAGIAASQPATFDLQPSGCDMVCVLGSYLGLKE